MKTRNWALLVGWLLSSVACGTYAPTSDAVCTFDEPVGASFSPQGGTITSVTPGTSGNIIGGGSAGALTMDLIAAPVFTADGGGISVATSDSFGPEWNYWGHNGTWVNGIDVANTPPSRDFVIAGQRGGYSFEDGVCNGTSTVTSAAQGGFASRIVGDVITGGGVTTGTTITAVASATSMTLSNTCATATSVRFTITDVTTSDIVYMKHRGARAPTIGFGITPPDGNYRVEIGGSDAENAMGSLGLRIGATQSGFPFAIYDSGGTARLWYTADLYLSGEQSGVGAALIIQGDVSNNRPLLFTDNARSLYYGFTFPGSNKNCFRYITGGLDIWCADTGGGLTAPQRLAFGAHEASIGTGLSATNLSSCGTGTPAISSGSTDVSGTITEGTTASGCTLAFGVTWTSTPNCVCSAETSAGAAVLVGCKAPNATTLVIVNAAATGNVVGYRCSGIAGST